MSASPLLRFLGVHEPVDDRVLLGLEREGFNEAAITAALETRLRRIDRHPDSDSDEADAARERVRVAAYRLRRELSRSRDGASVRSPGATDPALPTARPASPGIAGGAQSDVLRPAAGGSSNGPSTRAPGAPVTPASPVAPGSSAPRTAPLPPEALRRSPASPPTTGRHGEEHTRSPLQPQRPDQARVASAPTVPLPDRSLTPFDRLVLAVLIASGGWNAISRARLVALAERHNVSVDGLMRIVSGLADHVRRGMRRPAMSDLVQGAAPFFERPQAGPPSRVSMALERVQDAVADELTSERLWPRVRVSVIFGVLVLALGAIFVRVLFVSPERQALPQPALTGSDERAPDTAQARAAERTAQPRPEAPLLIARFDSAPTFRGETRPQVALAALERSAGIAAEIQDVGRRVVVDGGAVSEAALRQWRAALDDTGVCWPLMERVRRDQVFNAITEVLRGIDSASAGEKLLAALDPAVPRTEPSWIWVGAFRAGTLAEIVRRAAVLPPVAVQTASTILSNVLGASVVPDLNGFDGGAAAWLDDAAQAIAVEAGRHERFANDWEAWITAQREVRNGGDLQAAYAKVVETLLREQADLSTPGQGAMLLGRFIDLLDFERSVAVREAVARWMSDPSISANNLWVLTSLLATYRSVSWFASDHILPWDADSELRERVRTRLLAVWPVVHEERLEPRPIIAVERSQLERWVSALDAIESRAASTLIDREAMWLLLLTTELNEAAECFVDGQFGSGYDLASLVREAVLANALTGSLPPPLERGVASVPPGSWATAYASAGRDIDARLMLLRQLRLQPGGDLSPRDAEAFVREAVRGSPPELRSLARGILVERYAFGPTVVLELLDQLADAPRTEELDQIVTRITGAELPAVQSDGWMHAARAALARRALELNSNDHDGMEIDALATLLTGSLRRRAVLAGVTPQTPVSLATPTGAMRDLVEGWRDHASVLIATDPVPAPLENLDRRRDVRHQLADGLVANFVADQVGLLELIAYCITAQQPWSRESATAILAEASKDRAQAQTILEQALITELAAARLWRLALTAEEVTPMPTAPVEHEPLPPLMPPGSRSAPPAGTQPGNEESGPVPIPKRRMNEPVPAPRDPIPQELPYRR